MAGSKFGDDILTTPLAPGSMPAEGARSLTLNVIGAALVTHPLPARGKLVIGRSQGASICIDDASLSRQHAALHLGATLQIEDLGSVNGTRAGGRKLTPGVPHTLAVGETVELGTVTVVVLAAQRAAELAPGARPPGSRAPAVVVHDPAMRQLRELAERVALGNISVLLLGETGSGKEILAEAIHARSPRHARPLLRLNCAALAENLLESELFGHEKGAFSGAVAAKPGLLETAEGGSVFLDELGDMPAALQAKLLRVLEERKVTRVGGLKPHAIDVRFISATHRDLEAEAARGSFRQDLYYRLNGISLHIPPLRERTSEIEPLAQLFIARVSAELGRAAPRLSPDARAWLEAHPWPGNIRELRNVIERAVLLSVGGELRPEHLAASRPPPSLPEGDERSRIIAALDACAGNQTHAARLLGISRGTLVSRLAEYRIPRPRKR
jgi:DNA-binding NtrC family response regulator